MTSITLSSREYFKEYLFSSDLSIFSIYPATSLVTFMPSSTVGAKNVGVGGLSNET